jgi:hypothetical protein
MTRRPEDAGMSVLRLPSHSIGGDMIYAAILGGFVGTAIGYVLGIRDARQAFKRVVDQQLRSRKYD